MKFTEECVLYTEKRVLVKEYVYKLTKHSLVTFYNISTIVGHLMRNPIFILNI